MRMIFLLSLLSGSATAIAGSTTPTTVSIRSCDRPETPIQDPLKVVQQAVVRLETNAGSGSGFVLSADGFVLTADHVIAGATTVSVTFPDGSKATGTPVRRNHNADLALIKLDRPNGHCIPLASQRESTGKEVYVIGSPVSAKLSHSVSKGVVSAYRTGGQLGSATGQKLDSLLSGDVVILQTDATINQGNSGGVVLNERAEAVGIVSFSVVGTEGLGFAVATEEVERRLHLKLDKSTDPVIENWTAAKPASTLSFHSPYADTMTPGTELNTLYRVSDEVTTSYGVVRKYDKLCTAPCSPELPSGTQKVYVGTESGVYGVAGGVGPLHKSVTMPTTGTLSVTGNHRKWRGNAWLVMGSTFAAIASSTGLIVATTAKENQGTKLAAWGGLTIGSITLASFGSKRAKKNRPRLEFNEEAQNLGVVELDETAAPQ